MALRRRRGFGASYCGTGWNWLDPACWKTAGSISGRLIYGSSYPQPPMPPSVSSTLPGGEEIPAVPGSGEEAQQIVQSITDQQLSEWQARNQAFMEDLNSQVNPAPEPLGIPWQVWLAGGLLFAGIMMRGGRR